MITMPIHGRSDNTGGDEARLANKVLSDSVEREREGQCLLSILELLFL